MVEDEDKLETLELYQGEHVLSPSFYLHLSILRAIRAMGDGLRSGDFRNGLVERVMEIDQAEKIAIALGIIEDGEDSEYRRKIEEYKKKLEDEKDPLARDVKLAHFKLMLILQEIAERSPKSMSVQI